MVQESSEEAMLADGSEERDVNGKVHGSDGMVQDVGGVLMNKKQLMVGAPTDASARLKPLPAVSSAAANHVHLSFCSGVAVAELL